MILDTQTIVLLFSSFAPKRKETSVVEALQSHSGDFGISWQYVNADSLDPYLLSLCQELFNFYHSI